MATEVKDNQDEQVNMCIKELFKLREESLSYTNTLANLNTDLEKVLAWINGIIQLIGFMMIAIGSKYVWIVVGISVYFFFILRVRIMKTSGFPPELVHDWKQHYVRMTVVRNDLINGIEVDVLKRHILTFSGISCDLRDQTQLKEVVLLKPNSEWYACEKGICKILNIPVDYI